MPIHAVLVRPSHDLSTPTKTPYGSTDIRERVARLLTITNETWRATGVRFSVASVRQEVDATFSSTTPASASVTWSPGLQLGLDLLLGPGHATSGGAALPLGGPFAQPLRGPS